LRSALVFASFRSPRLALRARRWRRARLTSSWRICWSTASRTRCACVSLARAAVFPPRVMTQRTPSLTPLYTHFALCPCRAGPGARLARVVHGARGSPDRQARACCAACTHTHTAAQVP
jgi:hypothetical protein